jgi:rhodanese-related sulfurtransferase
VTVFDVRKESEFQATHIPNAKLVPLDRLNNDLSQFSKDKPFYLHCAGGYRSMIALSILKSRGIHNGINVIGGMKSIRATSIELSESPCSISS